MVSSDSQSDHAASGQGKKVEHGRLSSGEMKSALRMKRSVFAPLLKFAYHVLNCSKRWRIGRILMDITCRFEGGAMFSLTARELLSRYHDVHVGPYSYGPCFSPGLFPPQVHVGNYTSIADGVMIVNENHPMTKLSTHPLLYGDHSDRVVLKIENDVWLGYNVVILPGCQSIGTGAIIGAGSIVTKDIPPYAIAVGNPARVLRYRFSPEVCAKLLESKWWNKVFPAAQEFQEELGEDVALAFGEEDVELT